MIKIIKHSVFVILSVVFIVFCGEYATIDLYNRVGEKMNNIVFSACYDYETTEKDIEDLIKKYDVIAFDVMEEDADVKKDIWVCMNSDEKKIKELVGIGSCTYNTIFDGKHSLILTDKSHLADVISSENSIFDIYFYADEETAYNMCDELAEKYAFTLYLPEKKGNMIFGSWIICLSLIFLISVYDVLAWKKEICIKLTLGNSLKRQLAGIILKDTLIFAFSALITTLMMYNVTAMVLMVRTYALFTLSVCIVNGLVSLSLYFADVCSTLKNENSSAGYLYINYILKAVSGAVLILVLSMGDIIPQQIEERKCAEAFGECFADASYVKMYQSTQWASKIDNLSDKEDQGPLDDKSVNVFEIFCATRH